MKKILLTFVLFGSYFLTYSQKYTDKNLLKETVQQYKPKYEDEKLIDLVKGWDISILNANDEVLIKNYLIPKCEEVKNYIKLKYPQYGDVDEIVDIKDPAAPMFSLFYAMWEANDFKTLPAGSKEFQSIHSKILPQWLICTLETLGVAYGLNEITTTLATFETASAWRIAKFFVKKYVVGWLGTAVAIYQVATTCF
ncbi:MAG TPA: hypothetical protein V6C58_09735 [Allocoleopsis sp.]